MESYTWGSHHLDIHLDIGANKTEKNRVNFVRLDSYRAGWSGVRDSDIETSEKMRRALKDATSSISVTEGSLVPDLYLL